ncbi:SIR2 family protein [Nostocoides australiense]
MARRAALTTNYDALYEQAVAATGRPRPTVIPTNITRDGGQWILKMHGSREQGDSIVLTRSDFVHFDARVKPAALRSSVGGADASSADRRRLSQRRQCRAPAPRSGQVPIECRRPRPVRNPARRQR